MTHPTSLIRVDMLGFPTTRGHRWTISIWVITLTLVMATDIPAVSRSVSVMATRHGITVHPITVITHPGMPGMPLIITIPIIMRGGHIMVMVAIILATVTSIMATDITRAKAITGTTGMTVTTATQETTTVAMTGETVVASTQMM
jgi:hypothetical protein